MATVGWFVAQNKISKYRFFLVLFQQTISLKHWRNNKFSLLPNYRYILLTSHFIIIYNGFKMDLHINWGLNIKGNWCNYEELVN